MASRNNEYQNILKTKKKKKKNNNYVSFTLQDDFIAGLRGTHKFKYLFWERKKAKSEGIKDRILFF